MMDQGVVVLKTDTPAVSFSFWRIFVNKSDGEKKPN